MSEAPEAINEEVPAESPAPEVDVQAIMAENEAMKGKLDELLSETKKAKAARREAEEVARKEAEERARKAGDFEQLHKSSEEARQQLMQELEQLRGGIASEKRDNAAMRLAGELAEGVNAELLAEFIKPRWKYTDDGLKVTNANGELTVSTLDDLKNDFKADGRYQALLKGNQASGGGASGGSKDSGGAAKQAPRAEFETWSPEKQMTHIKGGGIVI
jgi:alanyl-tRNA synthetase